MLQTHTWYFEGLKGCGLAPCDRSKSLMRSRRPFVEGSASIAVETPRYWRWVKHGTTTKNCSSRGMEPAWACEITFACCEWQTEKWAAQTLQPRKSWLNTMPSELQGFIYSAGCWFCCDLIVAALVPRGNSWNKKYVTWRSPTVTCHLLCSLHQLANVYQCPAPLSIAVINAMT